MLQTKTSVWVSLFQPNSPSLFPGGNSLPLLVSCNPQHPAVTLLLSSIISPVLTGSQSPGFKMGNFLATKMSFNFNIKYTPAHFPLSDKGEPIRV